MDDEDLLAAIGDIVDDSERRILDELREQVASLGSQEDDDMATVLEQIAQVATDVAAAKSQVDTDLQTLRDALDAALAGATPDPAVAAALTALDASVQAIDPPVVVTPPPPPVA